MTTQTISCELLPQVIKHLGPDSEIIWCPTPLPGHTGLLAHDWRGREAMD